MQPVRHIKSLIVDLDDMNKYEYGKGIIPIIVNHSHVYYLDGININKKLISEESVELLYKFPFEGNEFPKIILDFDKVSIDNPNYGEYVFEVSDSRIVVTGILQNFQIDEDYHEFVSIQTS